MQNLHATFPNDQMLITLYLHCIVHSIPLQKGKQLLRNYCFMLVTIRSNQTPPFEVAAYQDTSSGGHSVLSCFDYIMINDISLDPFLDCNRNFHIKFLCILFKFVVTSCYQSHFWRNCINFQMDRNFFMPEFCKEDNLTKLVFTLCIHSQTRVSIQLDMQQIMW